MIDKTLCSDFAMCIFDRFVDGDTFEKYAKIVRNLIDALIFDSTISSSDAVAFVQEMVKQAGSRGFNFSNESDINNLTKYIISLDIPFDDKTLGPIIQSVNAVRGDMIDYSTGRLKENADMSFLMKNGYKYVVLKMMGK
jgi:hypothetical protein